MVCQKGCEIMMEFVLICASTFQNPLFQKILSGIPSESNILDPDQARQNVYKGDQQTTLVNTELKLTWFSERLWLHNERKLGLF